jgi:pimeloyl-ACP methyl ester carboxylesterase
VVLVGDSLGGYSAMHAAAALPATQLRGLVVAGASEDVPARLRLSKWGERLFVRWLLALKDPDELAPKALSRFGVAPADQRAMLAAGVRLHAVELAVDALLGADFRGRLARVPQPILFVNGDGDAGRIDQEADFLQAAPAARAIRYENTGHGVSMLRPERFAADLNAFAAQAFPPLPPDELPLP